MNRLVFGIAVVLAFGLVAVAAAPSASASTAMPTWSAGNYWVYTLNAGALIPGLSGAATLRYDVVGPDSLSIGGNSVSVWKTKLNMSVSLSSGSVSIQVYFNGNAWFRQSDLGAAETTFSATVGTTSMTITNSYNPPQAVQWPLTAGAEWNTTTNVTTSVTGSTPTTVQETFQEVVQADQSITVPAGTFTVTPLKETTQGSPLEYSVYYWSATAGNYVSLRQFYTSNDTQAASIDLQSYSYSSGGGEQSFLGLPILAWVVIVVVIVAVAVAVVLLRRKKPAAPMAMPPTSPPGMTPMPGQPPQQPPQGPPGPPPQP